MGAPVWTVNTRLGSLPSEEIPYCVPVPRYVQTKREVIASMWNFLQALLVITSSRSRRNFACIRSENMLAKDVMSSRSHSRSEPLGIPELSQKAWAVFATALDGTISRPYGRSSGSRPSSQVWICGGVCLRQIVAALPGRKNVFNDAGSSAMPTPTAASWTIFLTKFMPPPLRAARPGRGRESPASYQDQSLRPLESDSRPVAPLMRPSQCQPR